MKASESEMLDAWSGLLFAHVRVMRSLEADMVEQHGLTLSWFDILGRLKQAPGQRLRMHELEELSVFTRSGMTRLMDRIEAAGFVQRERSTMDRRGVYVAITSAGIDKIDAVWPDHVASIERHFGRCIDSDEATALTRISRRIQVGERLKASETE
jgi:DNA-binding MarR family transcriptional regulator